MDSIVSFGDWVRSRRKSLDLTQDQLGSLVGCSVSAIRKIESDQRRPSRQISDILANVLQIAPEQKEDFIRSARGLEGLCAGFLLSRTDGNRPEMEQPANPAG